ncbi:MAG: hypothetical protein MO852_03245 [Candidatus Devosia euplotis]|nr:hypothetical protein [Candidatus Devosia euplotis]
MLEYENMDSNMEVSPIEMQPSVRIDKSDVKTNKTLSNGSSDDSPMSSDIRDSSMLELQS